MIIPHSKDAQMRRHIEAWQSSGQSQTSYCKQHKIPVHSMVYYRHKFGYMTDKSKLPGDSTQLVPVKLTEPATQSQLTIKHTNGFSVCIESDVDTRQLRNVLSVINDIK